MPWAKGAWTIGWWKNGQKLHGYAYEFRSNKISTCGLYERDKGHRANSIVAYDKSVLMALKFDPDDYVIKPLQ